MKRLLILAAAASLAVACHNRYEDEVGAAPTGRHHRRDPGRHQPGHPDRQHPGPAPGGHGHQHGGPHPPDGRRDSTTMAAPSDSANVPSSAGNQQGDSAMTDHSVPDSASAGAGAAGAWSDSTGATTDSTSKQ